MKKQKNSLAEDLRVDYYLLLKYCRAMHSNARVRRTRPVAFAGFSKGGGGQEICE